jgi:hypothetical protein
LSKRFFFIALITILAIYPVPGIIAPIFIEKFHQRIERLSGSGCPAAAEDDEMIASKGL